MIQQERQKDIKAVFLRSKWEEKRRRWKQGFIVPVTCDRKRDLRLERTCSDLRFDQRTHTQKGCSSWWQLYVTKGAKEKELLKESKRGTRPGGLIRRPAERGEDLGAGLGVFWLKGIKWEHKKERREVYRLL